MIKPGRTNISKVAKAAFAVGLVVLAVMAIGFFADRAMFFRAWIFGWYFWASLSLGCLAILMLQYVIHGEWGFVIRRQLEAGVFTLPAMILLFAPVLLGMHFVYEWATEGTAISEANFDFKYAWLQPKFFVLRSVIYFAIFLALLGPLLAWSRDNIDPEQRERRLNALGAGGLILYFLVFTLAAFDWIMSLEPEWHSTIFGAQLMMGQGIMTISFVMLVTVWLRGVEPLRSVAKASHINDLGNLMLAFVMLWTYMAFVQYLIIWNGNLREDNVWYVHRSAGWWPVLAAALAIIHFAVPFAILLSRGAKRNGAVMAGVASLLIVAHAGDCFWLVAPNFTDGRDRLSWMDVAAVIGIGGVWLGLFMYRLASVPLVPEHDVKFEYVSRRAAEGEA